MPPVAGKYAKLVNRFFEPLLLLQVLGQVRGDRPFKESKSAFRQFLDDLALLCEFDKGGDACTAIGCEDRPDATVFWVAANTNASAKIAPFLSSVLCDLKSFLPLLVDDAAKTRETARLTSKCIQFCTPKIKKLNRLLKARLLRCAEKIEKDGSRANTVLLAWLYEIKDWTEDSSACCQLLFESRHSEHMDRMRVLDEELFPDGQQSPFAEARHYIGRLCQFVSAPQRLVAALSCAAVTKLVDDVFVVRAITQVQCVSLPRPDKTTLEGICTRMLPAKSSEKPRVIEALREMDRKHGIVKNMKAHYISPTFKPRVHAEIRVLEAFHEKDLQWAYGDKYIGCSKPACFCCKLYLRYHPSRPVELESHEKVYRNWGPIWLCGGEKDPRYEHQRSILNEMVKHFRQDALEQLMNLRDPRRFHADSRTGITSDVPDAVPDDIPDVISDDIHEDIPDDVTDDLLVSTGSGRGGELFVFLYLVIFLYKVMTKLR